MLLDQGASVYELVEFDGVDVASVFCMHGRDTMYRSRDHASWPPSMTEIQTAYPPPKNMLPEDVEKKLSEHRKGTKLPRKDKGESPSPLVEKADVTNHRYREAT